MQKKKSHHILLGIAAMIGIGGIVASVLMIKNQPIQTNYNYIKKEVEVINPVYKKKEEIIEKEVLRKNLIKDKQYYYDQLKDIVENKIKIDVITQLFLKVDFSDYSIQELEDLIDFFNNIFFTIDVKKDSIENVILKNDTNYFQLFSIYEDFRVKEEFIVNQINLNEYFNNMINTTFTYLNDTTRIERNWNELISSRLKEILKVDLKNTAIFKKSHQRYKEILQWNDATVNAKINKYVNQNFNQPNHNLEDWYRFLMDLQPTNPPTENQPSDTNNTNPNSNPTPPSSNDTSTNQPENPQDQPTPIENDPPQPPISNEIVLERNEINTSLNEEINKTIINTPNTNLKEKFIEFKNQLQNEPNNDKHKKLLQDIKTFNDTLNEVYTKLNQLKENAQIKKVLDRFNENNNIITLIDGINDNNDIINEVNTLKNDYDTLINVGVEIQEEIIPNLNDAPELITGIIENPEVNNTTLFRNKKEENITNPYWFKTNAIFNKYKELYEEVKVLSEDMKHLISLGDIGYLRNLKDWKDHQEEYKFLNTNQHNDLELKKWKYLWFKNVFDTEIYWDTSTDSQIFESDIHLQLINYLNEINHNEELKQKVILNDQNAQKEDIYYGLKNNSEVNDNEIYRYRKHQRQLLNLLKIIHTSKEYKMYNDISTPLFTEISTTLGQYLNNVSYNSFSWNESILIPPKQSNNNTFNNLSKQHKMWFQMNMLKIHLDHIFKEKNTEDITNLSNHIEQYKDIDNLSSQQQIELENYIKTDFNELVIKYMNKITQYHSVYMYLYRNWSNYNKFIDHYNDRYVSNELLSINNELYSLFKNTFLKIKNKQVFYEDLIEMYNNLKSDIKIIINKLDESLNKESSYQYSNFNKFNEYFFNRSINSEEELNNLPIEEKKRIVTNTFIKKIISNTQYLFSSKYDAKNINLFIWDFYPFWYDSSNWFIDANVIGFIPQLRDFVRNRNIKTEDNGTQKAYVLRLKDDFFYIPYLPNHNYNFTLEDVIKFLNDDFSTFDNIVYQNILEKIKSKEVNIPDNTNNEELRRLKELKQNQDNLTHEQIKDFIKYYYLYKEYNQQ